MSFNPDKWKIGLPLYPPEPVMDFSSVSEYGRCPTKGLYRYGMRRGFGAPTTPTLPQGISPSGVFNPELQPAQGPKNYAIQWGLAYHKYRELVENLCEEEKTHINPQIHIKALEAAFEGWQDPPPEHKHSFLVKYRMVIALTKIMERIKEEQSTGRVKVTRAEEPFDLEMDWAYCHNCGWTEWEIENTHTLSTTACIQCGFLITRARHGGRVDQHIIFKILNNANMIRDFKTTMYMPSNYQDKFDPNGAIQGYVWSGQKLSGRKFDGALIETLYTTKTKGPEIHQTYVTFTPGQQERWEASMMMERQFIMTSWARVEELGYLAFPQRTSECNAFGGCPFREACRMGSGKEIDQWLENYTIYSHWDFTNPEIEESVA